MIGARYGQPNLVRRLLSRATARTLRAFVVPGVAVARARGLDLEAAGLQPVANPRHGNVIVLVSPIPEALVDATVVTYAQMPRPRAILAVGDPGATGLPEADVRVEADQQGLLDGVAQLRELFSTNAWQSEIEPFQHDALQKGEQESGDSMGHQHHGHAGNGHGEGHEEHQHESHAEHQENGSSEHAEHEGHEDYSGHHGHEAHAGHQEHGNHQMEHGSEHGDHNMEMAHDDHGEHGGAGGHQEHGGHSGHGGHEGHGGGFMSMIAVTKDLPRSPDGLQMDWLDVPFGPLHPGLPAGLNLTLTLDGDRIAKTQVSNGVTSQHLGDIVPAPVQDLPAKLAQLDRLAPGVYRLLADKLLQDVQKDEVVATLERTRVLSHLNWLASFSELIGYRWLMDEATSLYWEFMESGDVDRIQERAGRMRDRAEGSFLLKRRLDGVGRLTPDACGQARGPVARAMGLRTDARLENPLYRSLGFEPHVEQEGDALARLRVRLGEIMQSLDLIWSASLSGEEPTNAAAASTMIETPRGQATIHATVEGGQVTHLHLDTPSTQHMSLISAVSENAELSNGLIGIASLDLSPWEVVG